jgi:hypothetical protein
MLSPHFGHSTEREKFDVPGQRRTRNCAIYLMRPIRAMPRRLPPRVRAGLDYRRGGVYE